ncbi:hypothetical protein DB88DRAFT_103252 [Papiliotrema laurentii]|uniref:Secreted protein n=1 Tax=Papiliotrema laurentii TaxID=5418 RepID=A0AAD9FMW3_PAPLA|nr:hypothetical protein DB88DRAFT_103252 [Papiliotrema laurentii]
MGSVLSSLLLALPPFQLGSRLASCLIERAIGQGQETPEGRETERRERNGTRRTLCALVLDVRYRNKAPFPHSPRLTHPRALRSGKYPRLVARSLGSS